MSQIRRFKKKRFIFLRFLIPIVLVVLLVPCLVYAAEGQAVASILGWIIMPIVSLFGKLITLLIRLLISVAQYNDFINSAAVSKGWIIIRDVCNIGFVLVLLVIAFSTVLKIEKYSYKRLLGGFLLAAVLVNFSKLICGVIIDISQVLMLTFVNAFKGIGEGNLAQMIGLEEIMSLPSDGGSTGKEKVGALFLGLIMSIIGTIVVGIILLIFVFRIIILWFLVLLSPLAFLANILPALQSYGKQWWQKFTSQVIVGPILAFFLWLSFSIVQGSSGGDIYKQVLTDPKVKKDVTETEMTAAISKAGKPQNMLNFIIGIGMLIGSLMVAQQMGVAGGKMAGSAVGKIQAVAKGMGKLGLKGVDRTVEKVGKVGVRGIGKITGAKSLQRFQGVSYDIAKDALRQRKQEKARQRGITVQSAAAPISDSIEKVLDPGVWAKKAADIRHDSKKRIEEATTRKDEINEKTEKIDLEIDQEKTNLVELNQKKEQADDTESKLSASPILDIRKGMSQKEINAEIGKKKPLMDELGAAAKEAAKKTGKDEEHFNINSISGRLNLKQHLKKESTDIDDKISDTEKKTTKLTAEKDSLEEKKIEQTGIISTERYRPGAFGIKEREKLPLAEMEARGRQAEMTKEVMLTTGGGEELLIETLKESLANNKGDRAIATLELLHKINGFNAMMLDSTIQNQVRDLIGKQYTRKDKKGNNLAIKDFNENPVNMPALRLFYEHITKNVASLNDNEAARAMARIGSIGGMAGNFAMPGIAHIDSVTGLPKFGGIIQKEDKDGGGLEMDHQWASITRFKANQIESQSFWRNVHSSSFATEDNQGRGGHLHAGGKEYIAHISGKDIAQMSRMRDDTLVRLNEKGVIEDIRNFANEISNGLISGVGKQQAVLVNAFADNLIRQKTAVPKPKK